MPFGSLLACGHAMGLINIQFIVTTKWLTNNKDSLTVQKLHSKQYKAKLSWSNGGFTGICAYCETEKHSVAGCELGMLFEIQSQCTCE